MSSDSCLLSPSCPPPGTSRATYLGCFFNQDVRQILSGKPGESLRPSVDSSLQTLQLHERTLASAVSLLSTTWTSSSILRCFFNEDVPSGIVLRQPGEVIASISHSSLQTLQLHVEDSCPLSPSCPPPGHPTHPSVVSTNEDVESDYCAEKPGESLRPSSHS